MIIIQRYVYFIFKYRLLSQVNESVAQGGGVDLVSREGKRQESSPIIIFYNIIKLNII